jgi:membrane-bound lytic murein transglycosylase D
MGIILKKTILSMLVVGSCNSIFAFHISRDTFKTPLLASVEKKDLSSYVIKEANVIFPEILAGNEDQSLDYIESFSENKRAYLISIYNRGKKLFPKAAAILKKQHLPQELKVLLALESGFNANAISSAGAVGYWQFMDKAAVECGLQIVPQLSADEKKKLIKTDPLKADSIFKAMAKAKDDRKNFAKSTNAAARYFKSRSRNLNNDLLLMVASYNCGIGNIWNAMAASGKKNADFWDIKNLLPSETRNYVMNFIALNVIYNNYDKFNNNTLAFKPIKIPSDGFEQNAGEAIGESVPGNLR